MEHCDLVKVEVKAEVRHPVKIGLMGGERGKSGRVVFGVLSAWSSWGSMTHVRAGQRCSTGTGGRVFKSVLFEFPGRVFMSASQDTHKKLVQELKGQVRTSGRQRIIEYMTATRGLFGSILKLVIPSPASPVMLSAACWEEVSCGPTVRDVLSVGSSSMTLLITIILTHDES